MLKIETWRKRLNQNKSLDICYKILESIPNQKTRQTFVEFSFAPIAEKQWETEPHKWRQWTFPPSSVCTGDYKLEEGTASGLLPQMVTIALQHHKNITK